MTAVMAFAAEQNVQDLPWLTPLVMVLTVLLGGGGIGALIKVRHDRKLGVAQQEVVEDDALSNRWKTIIEAQTKSLLEPLQTRLTLTEQRVTQLEQELEATRKKYWSAIGHIRTLYNWIARHLPEPAANKQVPEPPSGLAEDI